MSRKSRRALPESPAPTGLRWPPRASPAGAKRRRTGAGRASVDGDAQKIVPAVRIGAQSPATGVARAQGSRLACQGCPLPSFPRTSARWPWCEMLMNLHGRRHQVARSPLRAELEGPPGPTRCLRLTPAATTRRPGRNGRALTQALMSLSSSSSFHPHVVSRRSASIRCAPDPRAPVRRSSAVRKRPSRKGCGVILAGRVWQRSWVPPGGGSDDLPDDRVNPMPSCRRRAGSR
jgi:hypothetical protein